MADSLYTPMGEAMEPFRLRLKVGVHEFEAEGDQESVERQLAVWRDLIATTPAATSSPLASPPPPPGGPAGGEPGPPPAGQTEDRATYEKIFGRDGGVVALSVLPNGERREADAALLILLGQKVYNLEDQVTGGRLLSGLERSGIRVARADRMFGDYMDRYVIRSGTHRAVRYRLTIPGFQAAQTLARELATRVP